MKIAPDFYKTQPEETRWSFGIIVWLLVNICFLIAPLAYYSYIIYLSQHSHTAGLEYSVFAVFPLLIVGYLVAVIDIICLSIYVQEKPRKRFVAVARVALALCVAYVLYGAYVALRNSRF